MQRRFQSWCREKMYLHLLLTQLPCPVLLNAWNGHSIYIIHSQNASKAPIQMRPQARQEAKEHHQLLLWTVFICDSTWSRRVNIWNIESAFFSLQALNIVYISFKSVWSIIPDFTAGDYSTDIYIYTCGWLLICWNYFADFHRWLWCLCWKGIY